MSTSTLEPDTISTGTSTDADLDEAFRSITEIDEKVKDDDGTGDHERFSHYVSKEDIVRSSMTGAAVFALCGKKWTPTKNPDNFPVCPECKDAHEKLAK